MGRIKKEWSYLAWYHSATSQCRHTYNRREDWKARCSLRNRGNCPGPPAERGPPVMKFICFK